MFLATDISKPMQRQREVAISFLIASAMFSVGCTQTSPKTVVLKAPESAAVISEDAAETVVQNQLSSRTDEFVGKTVSLRGEVRAVIEGSSFLLEDERLLGGDDILVINGGEPIALLDGDESDLQVIGIVQQLVLVDLEKDYGIKLDPDLYAEYENRPAIVAQTVVLTPGPGELTRDPEKYYNQRIAVSGEVDDMLSSTVFTLDEEQFFGGEDLLVIGQMANTQVKEDEEVIVTGVLRPYVKAEFEQEYTLNWDDSVQAEIDAEYTDKPVFVAEDLYRPTL
ncbi:MAG: hypothetical protein ACFBSF_13175 [Leptolyngbyaceae cyanobacterium]